MVELVAVYDKNKNKQDKYCDRNNIPNGLFYFSINAWIVFDKDKIMIQKRSKYKTKYPNKFECVAGGVVLDEQLIETVQREIKEEIGLVVNKNKINFINEYLDVYHQYFMFTYVVFVDQNQISNIFLDSKEVSEYSIVDLETIKKMVNDNLFADSFFARFNLYYNDLKKIIDSFYKSN